MLRVVVLIFQSMMLVLIGYTILTALPGWRNPTPAGRGSRTRRLRVVIAAHDEATVIAGAVRDLLASDYPRDRFEVWVIADRCRDATATVAATAGARVAERDSGPDGKGHALAWHLETHPLGPDEALVVVDADNRVPAAMLARFADELDSGAEALQAYLDVLRPESSWLAAASALSYWASNRMVQLARTNLGWSADLGGTGMCITATALTEAGGISGSLVEDQDLGVRLALAGHPVRWLHDVRVVDEKPARASVLVRQRARWAAGRRRVARQHVGALLRSAIRQRRWGLADHAIRLVQPSRIVVAAAAAAFAVAGLVVGGDALVPWPVWAGAAGLMVGLPVPFLIRDGVPARWVLRYPILAVFALLWLPVQVVSRVATGWFHTPHTGPGEVASTGDEPSGESDGV